MSAPLHPAAGAHGPYVPRMRATWWLSNPRYFLFMVRELTSVFIAAFVVLVLLQVRALGSGPETYQAFVERLRTPGWIAFHTVALLFALYHSLTWFHLTSRIQIVRLGQRVVAPRLVTALNVVAWLAISGVLLFLWAKG